MAQLPDNDVELYEPNRGKEVSNWVFVSHTSADRKFIEEEVLPSGPQRLNFYLLDYKDYQSASMVIVDAYKRKTLQTLSYCAWFMVAVSAAAVNSKWVRFEVQWAIEKKDKQRIIVLLLEDCDPTKLHPELALFKPVDFRRVSEKARKQLEEMLPGIYSTSEDVRQVLDT